MQLSGCLVVLVTTALLSVTVYIVSATHRSNDAPHSNEVYHQHSNGRAVHDAATQTHHHQPESSRFHDDVSTFVDDEDDQGGLAKPYGVASNAESRFKNLMIVSTLDGKLSALDAEADGSLLWSINVGAKPLLSSSISTLEVFRNGRNSRLIPSLDGSLYQFNGDDMERLPFNADTLLSSSTKLTDDTMVVGSRDVTIFGISPYTGQVKYICGSGGCGQSHDDHSTDEDIIAVKRKSHTVRAIHITSGEEKWNFSVGQDDIEFIDGIGSGMDEPFVSGSIPVKVFVPDGVIVASDSDQTREIWRHQFDSPITKAWRLQDGNLEEISMFDCKYVPTLHDGHHVVASQPMIFFGMHHGQLYVQPSISGAEHPHIALDDYIKSLIQKEGNQLVRRVPRIRWKPYLSTAPSRTPHLRNMVKLLDYDRGHEKSKDRQSTDEDYPYDSGYYLIPDITYLPDYIPELEHVSDEKAENDTDYLIYINESIWVWWKEIVAISLCTSVFVQILMNRVFFRPGEDATSQSSQKERTVSESSKSDETDYQQPGVGFVSRFHTDFEVMETLGRGGFGVVFKAKNKMDELEYAVKRICVKNTPESREKVLREARAMAKLEHVGIIRYYQVFVETPPAGWQRIKDLELFGRDVTSTMSTSPVTDTPVTPEDIGAPTGAISKKVFNPLHINFSEDTDNSDIEPQGRGDYNRSGSLEVVFEHSDSNSIPFRRYRNSENQCDSGCSDVSTHKDDNDYNMSSDTDLNVNKTVSVTSGSGSFSLHNDVSQDPVPVVEKPPKLYLYIQMQLCERQTLKDWLSANTLKRDCKQMLDYFTQIVHAVSYVHDHSLIHRDLKPSNIYFSVNDNNIIKIGDFGLVTAHEDEDAIFEFGTDFENLNSSKQHTNQVGTQLYMSPEQMNGLPYDQKVDIFSLGLIFLEFFYPCSTQMEKITVLSDAKRGKLPARFARELRKESEFVRWLLSEEASHRPTAVEMLESDLLRDVMPSSMTGTRRTNSVHRMRTSTK